MMIREIAKILTNPQNIYDGILLGLNYMPTKPVAVATAAIASGIAVYVLEPETFSMQLTVMGTTSGCMWAITETTHYIAHKLWNKRLAKIKADWQEYEKTPEAIETKRRIDESINKLFEDPNFLKKFGME